MGEMIDTRIINLVRMNQDSLVGLESATGYWGLSTYCSTMPHYLYKLDIENGYKEVDLPTAVYLFSSSVNLENVVYLSEKFRITDMEQTICDMIRFDRQEFHLFETVISAFEDSRVNKERLNTLAEEYGIRDRLNKIYIEAIRYEDEG